MQVFLYDLNLEIWGQRVDDDKLFPEFLNQFMLQEAVRWISGSYLFAGTPYLPDFKNFVYLVGRELYFVILISISLVTAGVNHPFMGLGANVISLW